MLVAAIFLGKANTLTVVTRATPRSRTHVGEPTGSPLVVASGRD
jgi:hypothetical protein